MNRILESYINEFKKQYSLESKSESTVFEYFCAFCIASKTIYDETITRENLDNIVIGSGNDWGIDGIQIKINNILVESISELDEILKQSPTINVDIILIQAKTSESIDHGELKKFLAGTRNIIKYLFQKVPDGLPPYNQSLEEKLIILDRIYKKAALFPADGEYNMPKLSILYMHAGSLKSSEISKSDFLDNINFIGHANLVNLCVQDILNDRDISSYYSASKRHLKRVLTVEQHLPLPKVDNIVESHLCLLPFREFKKLITAEEDGGMLKQIFEDNVRDFQGKNRVNDGIDKTLKNGELKLFTALNNGITVIARETRFIGSELTLSDYQIVNGCQTCHVLYNNRNIEGIDDLILSVKVITSTDKNIRDKIVVANNSQTEVKREQLLSLLEAQRNIEEYYLAQKNFTKLYYERRSKQYKYGTEAITADKVITIPTQIHAFVSMILGKPHLNRNYYGKIIEQVDGGKNTLFDRNIKPAFYYTSALAAHERNRCLGNGVLSKDFKSVKHHLLLAFRLVASPKAMPQLNSNAAQSYCDEMCTILCNEEKCNEAFKRAAELIRLALGRVPEHNDLNDASLTNKILETFYRNKGKYIQPSEPYCIKNVQDLEFELMPKDNNHIEIQKPRLKIVGRIDLDNLPKGHFKTKKK